MWISDKWQDFELIDCSKGEKLERWGRFYLVRPDPQAIWDTPRGDARWNMRDARYRRASTGGGAWDKGGLPASWKINYGELTFNVKPMNFKHTGLFPEQACNWDFAMNKIRTAGRPINVLNLFAYTGAATIACAKAGASVCHVDAAKGMVAWGRENAAASGLSDAPIRWIDDDCAKFVEREIRRGRKYDAIIALGAVIRGSTSHYDYVCAEVSKGCAQVSLNTGLPVMFGILTTDTIQQAIERAGTKAGNKGYDCAMGAIEMINCLKQI